MTAAPMIKKSSFMAGQGKEELPTFETVTIFTPEEIAKFKAEAVRAWGNGTRIYQQAAYADAEHRTPHRGSPRTAEQVTSTWKTGSSTSSGV